MGDVRVAPAVRAGAMMDRRKSDAVGRIGLYVAVGYDACNDISRPACSGPMIIVVGRVG